MTGNGRTPAGAMGTARQPLSDPEQAGTISVAEAAEIRERKRLREKYEADLKAKQDEANDIAKIITLLRMENEQFLTKLLRDRDLNLDDDYNVMSESGLIWRTAIGIQPAEVTVEDTEPEVTADTPLKVVTVPKEAK